MGLLKKSNAQELFDAYTGAYEARKRELDRAAKERENLARELKKEEERQKRKQQAAKRKLSKDLKKQLTDALTRAFDGYNATLLNEDYYEFLSKLGSLGFSAEIYNEARTAAQREVIRLRAQHIESKDPAIINKLNGLKYELEIEIAKKIGKTEAWVRSNLLSVVFKDIEQQALLEKSRELDEILRDWTTLPSGRYVKATQLFKKFDRIEAIRDISFNESFITRMSYHALLLKRAVENKRLAIGNAQVSMVSHDLLLSDEDLEIAEATSVFLLIWRNPLVINHSDEIDADLLHWVSSPAGQSFANTFNKAIDEASKAQRKDFCLKSSNVESYEGYVPATGKIQKALKLMGYEVQVIKDELRISFD